MPGRIIHLEQTELDQLQTYKCKYSTKSNVYSIKSTSITLSVFYCLITLVVINQIGGGKIHSSASALSNSDVSLMQNDYDSDKTKCIQSLLVNRHRISDSAFNATSEVLDPSGAQRYNAHSIRNENTDFAWCPGKRIGTECDEYIEVDMGELNIITKVVISGLLAEDGGSRYTPYFFIRYKREQSEDNWRTYRQLRPTITSRLLGGLDALVPKFVVLDPPLIARWIRIYPYRDPPGFVCIRLEAYGCRFSDDLVEYRIPEGSLAQPPYQAETHLYKAQGLELFAHGKQNFSQAGGGLPFSDTCYDGHRIEPGSLLDGGLGCLIDLNIASRDTTPLIHRGSKTEKSVNHQFVGWHRDRWRSSQEKNNDVLDMLFRFASVRNFTRLRFYVSNNHLEKIRIPRRIEVKFSVGGVHFSGQSSISRDFKLENRSLGVFNIIMDLSYRIGQVVQLKAFFSDDWLLFSEIRFESEKVTASIKLDESSSIAEKSFSDRMNHKEDPVNAELESDTNKASPVNDAVLDDSSTRLSTVVILVLVLLCCFLGLLAGIACFSVTWMHRKRHDLEREKHQVHKTLLIRGEDGLNAYSTGLHGNGDFVIGSSGGTGGGAYTAVRPNMYPFVLPAINSETGVSTILPNGGLQSYHQMILSSNTSAESTQSGSNDKNPSQQHQQQQQQTSQSGVGIVVDQSNTITNRLSGGTTGHSDGVTSETEAFCDHKFGGENHAHRHGLPLYSRHYHHHHQDQQQSPLLSLFLCMSKMKKYRDRCSLKANHSQTTSQINRITNDNTVTNVQRNINCRETENSHHNNINGNLPHTEFLNGIKDFSIAAQLAKSQSRHDLGLCPTDLLNARIRGQTTVQTANGLLQIDLSRSNPSMLINGQPLIQIPASSNPADMVDNSWLIQTGYHNHNAIGCSSLGMNLMNTEPGVYTTVGGAESDVDSNAASTMSPEYASTSMVHDYPVLAATLAQIDQQRLAALAAVNVQSNLYPCQNPLNTNNFSSSSSINFNVLLNPPLNSPFDNEGNNSVNTPAGHMHNFLTSVNAIQHPLLFSNLHSMHDVMMLTTETTTAPTKLLNAGTQSSTNNILSQSGFTETDSSSHYGTFDAGRGILSKQQGQQIYEAYQLPSPSAPVYYPAQHQIISSSMGQYLPCIPSAQSLVFSSISSSISQPPLLSLSSVAKSNNNNSITNSSTLVGRGYSNNEYKSPKRVDFNVGQLQKLSDVNKPEFNEKSVPTTNSCLPNSQYRVSDHNPWIKASNVNHYDLEQHQRRQHDNLLPPTPPSPPPPLPSSATLKNH
ncbi:unnamed protein product [Heterobilharzia americana]|nr:unnamed protein product [Heterobilharzia americana]CAH8446594.1 unnamed protein product [Heterobilharzia americana]